MADSQLLMLVGHRFSMLLQSQEKLSVQIVRPVSSADVAGKSADVLTLSSAEVVVVVVSE